MAVDRRERGARGRALEDGKEGAQDLAGCVTPCGRLVQSGKRQSNAVKGLGKGKLVCWLPRCEDPEVCWFGDDMLLEKSLRSGCREFGLLAWVAQTEDGQACIRGYSFRRMPEPLLDRSERPGCRAIRGRLSSPPGVQHCLRRGSMILEQAILHGLL